MIWPTRKEPVPGYEPGDRKQDREPCHTRCQNPIARKILGLTTGIRITTTDIHQTHDAPALLLPVTSAIML